MKKRKTKPRHVAAVLATERNEYRWVNEDGQRLRPSEMSQEQLRNAISYTQRNLVRLFGIILYIDETTHHVYALHEMLKEAGRRGYRV